MYLQQISPRPLRTTISANSWHYATVRNSSKGAKWDRTQITGEDQDILYQSLQNSDQVKRYQFSKGSRRNRTNSFLKNKILTSSVIFFSELHVFLFYMPYSNKTLEKNFVYSPSFFFSSWILKILMKKYVCSNKESSLQ